MTPAIKLETAALALSGRYQFRLDHPDAVQEIASLETLATLLNKPGTLTPAGLQLVRELIAESEERLAEMPESE